MSFICGTSRNGLPGSSRSTSGAAWKRVTTVGGSWRKSSETTPNTSTGSPARSSTQAANGSSAAVNTGVPGAGRQPSAARS